LPQLYDLGKYSELLMGVSLIIGEGLCSNIYIIGREKATIIDTGIGNRLNPIFPQLEQLSIKAENIDKVVLTHAHHDHFMGVYLIVERANPTIYIHEEDARYIGGGLKREIIQLVEEDLIQTELESLEVYWTPGHTRGSICLYEPKKKILYSGDTVFPEGGFGRFDGESGSLKSIINSIKKLSGLDVKAIMPGHGIPVFQDSNKHIELSLKKASQWL
jgi:glyoxylase-like metal-dependent hydrolase (beta-lactamase superfamily II)